MRRAARTDSNQQEIVRFLRGIGATVQPTHAVGDGFPDLVVGWRGATVLIEVKDGSRCPSARRLTPDEERFHAEWRGGPLFVVHDVDDAIRLFQGLQVPAIQYMAPYTEAGA